MARRGLRWVVVRGSAKVIKLAFKPGTELLAGTTARPGARSQERASVMAMRLRVEELRLERARILAEEREKDRELARFRIEERRRLREDTGDRERQQQEDADLDHELETGLAKTRERLNRSVEDAKPDAEPTASGMSEQDRKISEEVARVIAGTWEPPAT